MSSQELLYDKEKLLANGDRWESEIAKNLQVSFASQHTQRVGFWLIFKKKLTNAGRIVVQILVQDTSQSWAKCLFR